MSVGALGFRLLSGRPEARREPRWPIHPRSRFARSPSGEVVREITPPRACKLAWGPDGTTLAAACEDTRIYVYDTETGRQTGVLADHTSEGIFAAFQPAGSLLASNGWDGKLRIWRPETGEMLLTLPAGGATGFPTGRIAVRHAGRGRPSRRVPGRRRTRIPIARPVAGAAARSSSYVRHFTRTGGCSRSA